MFHPHGYKYFLMDWNCKRETSNGCASDVAINNLSSFLFVTFFMLKTRLVIDKTKLKSKSYLPKERYSFSKLGFQHIHGAKSLQGSKLVNISSRLYLGCPTLP